MADEYLDLVDINNSLTGEKELRSKIHSTGLWHRTVHVYLFQVENKLKFLVHLRAKDKDLAPNCWDTRFGGHIQAGEKPMDAVVSELHEELGLNIDTKKLLEGKWRKKDTYPNREFSKVYYLEFEGSLDSLKFNDGEIQEIKWMPADEIIESMTSHPDIWSGNLKGFQEILTFLQEQLAKTA